MANDIICYHCGTTNQPTETFCENCGAALSAGSILLKQRYRVLNRLGAGGQGAVYRVEDTALANRLLAAKKLDTSNIPPKDFQYSLAAFRREAEILATLKHPNLPGIYEYFAEQSDHYLIMELIAGETLEDRLQNLVQGRLPLLEVVKIGIELATVLDYLHTRNPPIIFRDLKPDNIMLTPEGQLYLIDFGIARHFTPGQSQDTVRMGLPGYASPEVVFNTEQTTTTSDIYSLGAVLYDLLTGDAPQYKSPMPPTISGKAQSELSHLVMHMLAFDKNDRPSNVAVVKQQLQDIASALQQSTSTSTTQASTKLTIQLPPTVNAAPLSTQGVFQSLVASAKQGELYHSYTHGSQKIHALGWSPDGKHLAAAGEGLVQVSVWSVRNNVTTQTYKEHTRMVNALAWSPDSQLVASASNDYTVQLWEAASGKSRGLYKQHGHWVNALTWSPDGRLLASGDAQDQVHVWSAQGCQQKFVYRGHKSSLLALAFAPDSSRVASADQSGAVQVWDAADGKLLATYTGHHKSISALAWSPDGKQIVSGSWDGTLHLWDVAYGKQLSLYTGHQRLIKAVAWSPTNGLIASAGKDETVQIWNPQSGDTLYTYREHTSPINALAWSPDGKLIASAGDGAEVRVWWAM